MKVEGYESLELIGSGGNAHVYKATKSSTGEVVAVKILRGGGDESVIRRFERERTLMAQLETISNVVPIHESGIDDSGDPFLVMPVYEGGSLQGRLDLGPIPWPEALQIVDTMTASIAMAHAKRILHLDLKPANVLLNNDGQPWLADFGIAELMGSTASMSAQMMTPAFTPPERLDGGKPGEKTDLYGLMAMLFALLTAKPPYVTDETTGQMSVMMAILRDPIPLESLPADIPDNVRNLLARGMAKDPVQRPSSAIELQGLIGDAIAGRTVEPPVVDESAQADTADLPSAQAFTHADYEVEKTVLRAEASAVVPTAEPAVEEETKGARAALVPLAVAAVLAGAVVIGAVTFLSGGGDENEPVETATAAQVSENEAGDEVDEVFGSDEGEILEEVPEVDVLGATLIEDVSEPGVDVESDQLGAVSEATSGESQISPPTVQEPNVSPQPQTPAVASDIQAATATSEAQPASSSSTASPSVTTPTTATTEEPRVTVTATTEEPRVTVTATTEEPTVTFVPVTQAPAVTAPPLTGTRVPAVTVAPLEAGFIASPGPTGSEQTMSFQNITIGEAFSYRWDFGDGGTSSSFAPSHTYSSPGIYSVTITATGPDGSDSATHSVRVDANTVSAPPLEAGFIASPGPTGSEQTMSFQNITIGEADFYRWDFGDGTSIEAFAPSHTYSSPGIYSVTITATGPDGSDSATHSVRVDPNS